MKHDVFQTTVLAVAGFTALSIGAFIALDPVAFYAGYDIPLRGNEGMLSELRASGVNLGVLGAVMLSGIAVAPLRAYAVAASLLVFSAFPVGRLVGLVADGWPSEKVLVALTVELVIATLCFAARMAARRGGSHAGARH